MQVVQVYRHARQVKTLSASYFQPNNVELKFFFALAGSIVRMEIHSHFIVTWCEMESIDTQCKKHAQVDKGYEGTVKWITPEIERSRLVNSTFSILVVLKVYDYVGFR